MVTVSMDQRFLYIYNFTTIATMPCKNCVYLWEQIRIIKIKKAHYIKLKFNSLFLKYGDYYRCSKPGWSTPWTAASWRWSSRAWCSWSQCRGWVARSCPFGSWGSRGTYTRGYGSETIRIRCFFLRRILLIRIQCRKVRIKHSINSSLEKKIIRIMTFLISTTSYWTFLGT